MIGKNDSAEERNLIGDPALHETAAELRHSILDWTITADENDQIAPRLVYSLDHIRVEVGGCVWPIVWDLKSKLPCRAPAAQKPL